MSNLQNEPRRYSVREAAAPAAVRFARGQGSAFTLEIVAEEGSRSSWAGSASCCVEPTCACTAVRLELLLNGTAEALELEFDLRTREFVPPSEARPLPDKRGEFGRFLAAVLPADAWEWLTRWFLAAKRAAVDAADPEAIPAEFPSAAIEAEGLMVGWSEIFPHARSLDVTLGGRRHVADEQYCVRTGCRCHEVMLTFLDADAPEGEEDPVCLFDYSTGLMRHPLPERKLTQTIRRLVCQLEVDPAARERFADHHRFLKRAYLAFLRRQGRAPGAPTARRNDPCPCGSGRKFKTCCSRPS